MSENYMRFKGPMYFESPQGGHIRLTGEQDVVVPSPLIWPPSGPSFGPITTSVLRGDSAAINGIRFAQGITDGADTSLLGFPLLLAGLGSVEDVEDSGGTKTTRRDVLRIGGGLMALLCFGVSKSAADETLLNVVEFDIEAASETGEGALNLNFLSGISDLLPFDQTFLLEIDGNRFDYFSPEGAQGITLPPETSGTVRIYALDSMGLLTKSVGEAWMQFHDLLGDPELSFNFDLPATPTRHDPGSKIVLSKHRMLTKPILEEGGERTTVTIGGVSIPHFDEQSDSHVGYYFVSESGTPSLIYQVGEDPPKSSEAIVTVRADRLTELNDDITRTKEEIMREIR